MNEGSHASDEPHPRALRPFQKGDDPRRGRGPTPGAPNAGRPPDAVRRACREAFADRVPMLADLADNGTPEIRLKALDMLGRYGLGTTFSLDATDIMSGVIVLPELELRDLQAELHQASGLITRARGEEPELRYVIEDQTFTGAPLARIVVAEDEVAGRSDEETVDPEIVRRVLEKRAVGAGRRGGD